MWKLSLFLSTILLGVVLFFITVNTIRTESKVVPTSAWTKVICNEEKYCLDVQVTCGDNEVIDIKPTGEGAYFPENWADPRPIEIIEKWC
jgi:hypothetical protein